MMCPHRAPTQAEKIEEQEAEQSSFHARVFTAYASVTAWVMLVYSPLEAWIVARM